MSSSSGNSRTGEEKKRQEENEALINKCPFLWPRSDTASKIPTYDYSYMIYDSLEEGWKKTFIPAFCKEIQAVLNKCEQEDNPYIVTRANNINGWFKWITNWSNEELDNVYLKYKKIARTVCVDCGKKATMVNDKNSYSYCPACTEKLKRFSSFTPLDEFLKKSER